MREAFFIREAAGSCAEAELRQSSHFDLRAAHFVDRRILNPTGSICRNALPFCFFFSFRVISKLCVREALWLICRFLPFWHFPYGPRGKRKVTAALKWLLCMQGEAWMYACAGRKALARCWLDPQELVWHGNHTVHWICVYPHLKALLHFDVELFIIISPPRFF